MDLVQRVAARFAADRTGSNPEHTAKTLKELRHLLPSFQKDETAFRAAVQAYLKAAGGLNHADPEVMEELADETLQEKLGDLAKHLIEAEKLLKWFSTYNPHDPG